MPIVNVTWGVKVDANVKRDFFEYTENLINEKTGTPKQLVHIFIHEIDEENASQPDPIVLVDWIKKEPRTPEAKDAIQSELAEKLAEVTGLKKDGVVILFNDIPMDSAGVGGVVRK